jgi:hypothetical protein
VNSGIVKRSGRRKGATRFAKTADAAATTTAAAAAAAAAAPVTADNSSCRVFVLFFSFSNFG